MSPTLISLDHLVLTVADIEATVAFYCKVLGMTQKVFYPADGTRRTALIYGNQKINLHLKGREFDPKAHQPTPGSADLCFVTETSLSSWTNHLRAQNVGVIAGPVSRTGARGPMTSLYLRDPDENLIEIAYYQP